MSEQWHDLVVERSEELSWLIDRWLRAKSGDATCAVVLGEKGLGKTRLVLQFYRWMSTHEDPGYWPDAFGAGGALEVNPPPPAAGAQAHPIPWLWWGLRFPYPDERNVVGSRCALSDYRPYLAAHTDALAARLDVPRVVLETLFRTASLAASAIPLVNLAATAKDAVLAVRDTARDVMDVRRKLEESPLAALDRARDDLKEVAVEHCARVLGARRGRGTSIPLVLFLDDAQWADPTTLAFTADLLVRAMAEGWPLLVVATHWEAAWKITLADSPEPSLARLLGAAGVDLGEVTKTLGPVDDFSPIVRAAFPALPDAQVELVSSCAGGNPLLLHEVLRYLERQRRLFDAETGALSEHGARHLERRDFSLHQIVEERLSTLPPEVLTPLLWSSEQGMRFLVTVTAAAGVELGSSEAAVREALRQADRPHSIVELEEGDADRLGAGEFRQPLYHVVARRLLTLNLEERDAVREQLRVTLAAWMTSGEVDRLPQAEYLEALLIADRLLRPEPGAIEGEDRRAVWETALARLVAHYARTGLWDEAGRVARALLESEEAGPGLAHDVRDAVFEWLWIAQDDSAAHALLNEGLRRAKLQAAEPDAAPDLALEIARYTVNLSRVASAAHDWERTRTLAGEARRLRDELLDRHGDTRARLQASAESWTQLGNLEAGSGRPKEAIDAHRVALERLARIESPQVDPGVRAQRASALRSIGDALVLDDQAAEALEPLAESLALTRELVEESPEDVFVWSDVVERLAAASRGARAAADLTQAAQWVADAEGSAERFMRDQGETQLALGLMVKVSEAASTQRFAEGNDVEAHLAIQRAIAWHRHSVELYGERPDDRLDRAHLLVWSMSLPFDPTGSDPGADRLAAVREVLALFGATDATERDRFWSWLVREAAQRHGELIEERPWLAKEALPMVRDALASVDLVSRTDDGEWAEVRDLLLRVAADTAAAAGELEEAERFRDRLPG